MCVSFYRREKKWDETGISTDLIGNVLPRNRMGSIFLQEKQWKCSAYKCKDFPGRDFPGRSFSCASFKGAAQFVSLQQHVLWVVQKIVGYFASTASDKWFLFPQIAKEFLPLYQEI
ncbi:uncharacterized protein HLK63_G00033 [Nakaseomyces glabratus]|nr:uncharacterized protein GW608_G00033 [Nakaseomyces glabratus]UCS25572.1 uncharacterized protein HLK63_G00033 [Nakaseomyces glabratus]UCS30802.1 uncharacterized protein HLK64_G00033 [Nakaseomyces glabratus]UCS36031.1 uncharacterized protein HLK62_G00033 [Nakaseomyces glabratus]